MHSAAVMCAVVCVPWYAMFGGKGRFCPPAKGKGFWDDHKGQGGRSKGFVRQLNNLNTLSMKKNKLNASILSFLKSKVNLGISIITILLLGYLIFFL